MRRRCRVSGVLATPGVPTPMLSTHQSNLPKEVRKWRRCGREAERTRETEKERKRERERERKREREREERKEEEKRAEKNIENPYPHFCNISPANHRIEAPTGHPGPQNAPQNGSKNLQNRPKMAPGASWDPPWANLPLILIPEVNFGLHFGTRRGAKNRSKIDFFLKKARQGALV